MERNLRKERIGVVVSDKMDKTVVVAIEERKNFRIIIITGVKNESSRRLFGRS